MHGRVLRDLQNEPVGGNALEHLRQLGRAARRRRNVDPEDDRGIEPVQVADRETNGRDLELDVESHLGRLREPAVR